MGIFDGILLATDLDGTLANGFNFNEIDLKAIEYFKSEGGLFTLATGRTYEYVKSYVLPHVKPNAPVITLNGAVIYNNDCTELLYKSFIEEYNEIFRYIISYKDYIEELYVYYENSFSDKNCKTANYFNKKITVDQTATIIKMDDYVNKTSDIDMQRSIHKIVFSFNDEEKAIEAMESANRLYGSESNVCLRSWSTGLELLNKNNTKDSSVIRVKEMTNSRILVCAGDFENDIPMIKIADIGYAVGNALEHVKEAADRISIFQDQGAIAYIIKELPALL